MPFLNDYLNYPPAVNPPHWDAVNGRLTFGGIEVLILGHANSYQTCLLDPFQTRGWTTDPIPNPLAPLDGETAEERDLRLQVTAKNVNAGLRKGTIRFRVRGSHVRWEPAPPVQE